MDFTRAGVDRHEVPQHAVVRRLLVAERGPLVLGDLGQARFGMFWDLMMFIDASRVACKYREHTFPREQRGYVFAVPGAFAATRLAS
jgi:hypothetical protein